MLVLFSYCLQSFGQESEQTKSLNFAYLEFTGKHTIQATHDLPLAVHVPDGFKQLAPMNHQPEFNGHPFNISTAAFTNGQAIVMVHAERLTDSSGYLDYSYMTPAQLSGLDFYVTERCVEITDALMDEATDLNYFQQQGFDFYPSVYLKQYFVNSPDGNAEFVITYGERIRDCTENTLNDAFKAAFYKRLEETITVQKMN